MMESSFLKLSLFVLALLLVLGGVSSPAENAPAAPGLLYTNDFGTDPTKDTDNKWWVSDPTKITWVQDVLHEGKGSLKLSNIDNTKIVSTYGPYVAYTGQAVRLSIELKQDSVTTGGIAMNPTAKAGIGIYYYDQDKKEINIPWPKYHDHLDLPDSTLDWDTYEKTFTLPAAATGVAFVRVVITLPGSGTIWVDNINLVLSP